MLTPRSNRNTKFIKSIFENNLINENFFLVDVGCSGGIDTDWLVFENRLAGVGFDPYLDEVARLNIENKITQFKYVPAFVSYPNYEAIFPLALRTDLIKTKSNDFSARTSAVLAQQESSKNWANEAFNPTSVEHKLSDSKITLDDYFKNEKNIDFIKVDTDGSDFEVLLGASNILSESGVLGLSVECQMHGAINPNANLFCNIDSYLRAKGFTLFDLEVYRYSRASLPGPFMYNLPAQTRNGQVQWGEAIYFRDLGDRDYESKWGMRFSEDKILKLAVLFDLIGLGDCTAELLIKYEGFLKNKVDIKKALDLLSPKNNYREHVSQFHSVIKEKNFLKFSPLENKPKEKRVKGDLIPSVLGLPVKNNQGEIEFINNEFLVHVPGPRWSYAASWPRDLRIDCEFPVVIEIKLTVENATVGLGCVDEVLINYLNKEIEIKPGGGVQTCTFEVDNFSKVGHLVLRNTDVYGVKAKVTVSEVRVYAANMAC